MAADLTDVKEVIKMLADEMRVAYKNDPPDTVLTNTGAFQGPLQGNPAYGGLFAAPGVRPDRFSAMQRVRTLANLLKPMPSDIYNEILSIVTGATAASGTNPTDYCGNPANPGYLKQCEQTFKFGNWFSGAELNSVPDIGMLTNRAEVPGQILNSAPENYPLIPSEMWRVTDTRSQVQYELYNEGIMLERGLEPVMILGDPTKANTVTQLGWIKEFKGLDLQIKTGFTDTSGVTCPALDSIIINFNEASIGGTIGGGDGRTIGTAISDAWYAAQDRATAVGMDGVQFAFVMRKEMFRALTDYYANTYATTRFQTSTMSAGTPMIQDATAANALRLEMLNGMYLLVEGIPVPVVFSDGIPLEGLGNNTYRADMYLVPLEWRGRPLLRFEYFNMGNQYITEWNGVINPEKRRILNNGMFMMGYQSTGLCDKFLFASKMRLILETPFLAARIDNATFSYLAATRNAIPGTSLYANGGTSYYVPRAI